MPNLFGVDVSALDVTAFLREARLLFPILALAWLAVFAFVRKPWWLLAGVLLANAYAWGETNYPLQRLYAFGPSNDRVGNVALCQVVAAGHSPLRTAQVGQLHFEPFWGLLVAVLAGFDPDRVLRIYPYLPLVMAWGFALSLYFALRPMATPDEPGFSAFERALVAGFATLLSSTALDFVGTYRTPWALTFLLKPNHALGLVLLPWILRAVVGIRGMRDRILVGVLLHLLGWVFVLHMIYVAFGLVVYALWAGRKARLDVAVAVGVNLLVVSPYLVMLFVGYPIFQPGPRMQIPPWSAHLLEVTTVSGGIFALAVWGGILLARRRDNLARVWLSQAVGALVLWAAYFALSPLQLAKERDEVFYWTRFLAGVLAGIGAWDLAGRAAALFKPALAAPWLRAAAVAAVALPYSLPAWWDPARMDAYFPASRPPLAETLREPAAFLRDHTDPRAVIAGDHEAARWMAALSGRRTLFAAHLHAPKDTPARLALEEALMRGPSPPANAFGVRYLLVTPALLARYPPVTLQEIEARRELRRVHFTGDPTGDFVALYEVAPAP